VSAAETEKIVLDLDARYPFCEGVAGRTRRQILAFDVERVAGQLQAEQATQ